MPVNQSPSSGPQRGTGRKGNLVVRDRHPGLALDQQQVKKFEDAVEPWKVFAESGASGQGVVVTGSGRLAPIEILTTDQ